MTRHEITHRESLHRESKPNVLDAARDRIGRRLQESIDRLRDDIERVEYWTQALEEFSKPIPDYDPSGPLGHHRLPQRRDDRERS